MRKRCKHIFVEYWSFFFISIFLICTMVFLIIKKENVYVYYGDLLDSNIMWSKIQREAILNGSYTHVPFLKGDAVLDRLLKFSFSPVGLIYVLFPPFAAYVFCFYARMVIACSGWYVMAKNILPENQIKQNMNIIIFCGFLYGIIPIWPVGSGAFGFAVMPWMITDLLLIYKTGKWRYFLGIVIFPLWAGLALFGIFICGYLLFFIVCDTARNKRVNKKFLLAFIMLCISYFIFDFESIMQVTGGSTIYDTFMSESIPSMGESIDSFFHRFQMGHYHSGDGHKFVVLPVCIIGLIITNIAHIRKKKSIREIILDSPNLLMLWIIFNTIIYVLWENPAFINILSRCFPLLGGLNLSRTLWFNPFAWYLCFFLLLIRLREHNFIFTASIVCVCAFVPMCLAGRTNSSCTYNDIATNVLLTFHGAINGEKTDRLTWKEFYSENLFEEIKDKINYDDEWSVAFGMHPAILNYNGIYTLDGYYSGYSRQYKEQFSKLIKPYLDADSDKKDYFMDYGIRAYVFCDEADYDAGRNLEIKPCKMLIDSGMFREMEGVYVFSRVPISNFHKLGFQFIDCFTNEDSPYEIYVYSTSDVHAEGKGI